MPKSFYVFITDIYSYDITVSKEEFREQIGECLSLLDSLQGSFCLTSSRSTFYPPEPTESGQLSGWSVRCVVSFSVGKDRASHIQKLCDAMYELISILLPQMDVQSSWNVFVEQPRKSDR